MAVPRWIAFRVRRWLPRRIRGSSAPAMHQMTLDQFEALAELLRMAPGGASREAARLVLVEGISPADASRRTGIRPQSVNNALRSCERGLKLAKRAVLDN